MRPLLALLAGALLGVGACACGGTSAGSASHASSSSIAATTSSEVAATTGYTKADADKDNDFGGITDERFNRELNGGHAASAADRRTITALVKRYYASALADNGASACSMIYSTLAEAVPEDYGTTGGPPYMQGAKTCSVALGLLFKHYHAILALQVPKLKVTHVRLFERHGYALLSFGSLPEREISIAREGHVWRIDALLDNELR
jgi:hypothetical protein